MRLFDEVKTCTAAIVLGTSLTLSPPSMAADGKAVFKQVCAMCHQWGVAGAPRFGDKKAWAPRIAKGSETLYKHAIHGFKGIGIMPAKGGRPGLSDEQVKAAVDYMVSASK